MVRSWWLVTGAARSKCTGAKPCERGSPVPKKVGRLNFPTTTPASGTAIQPRRHVLVLLHHALGAAETKTT